MFPARTSPAATKLLIEIPTSRRIVLSPFFSPRPGERARRTPSVKSLILKAFYESNGFSFVGTGLQCVRHDTACGREAKKSSNAQDGGSEGEIWAAADFLVPPTKTNPLLCCRRTKCSGATEEREKFLRRRLWPSPTSCNFFRMKFRFVFVFAMVCGISQAQSKPNATVHE